MSICLNWTQKFQEMPDNNLNLWSVSSSGLNSLPSDIFFLSNAYTSSANPYDFLRNREEVASYVKFTSWSSNVTSVFIQKKEKYQNFMVASMIWDMKF